MYDTLLFLHLLTAFCLAATIVIYSAFALGAPASARSTFIADRLWDIGGLGTLVFGVWLAIYVKGYEVWDGWVIAAILLWMAAFGLQQQASGAMNVEAGGGAAALQPDGRRLRLFNALRALVFLLLLVDMIWKPGA